MNAKIIIKNAFEHNLKNINVEIPHNKLTVVTGVSGSGKSTLVYDIIYNESRKKYLESFTSYSRQFLGKFGKAKVESISGLKPALSVSQKNVISNSRSTVGTLSEVYDYLRLLFARVGQWECPHCKSIVKKEKDFFICSHCGNKIKIFQASDFSFNSSRGACPKCNGLGVVEFIDPKKLIADENKTLRAGALVPTTPAGYIVYSQVTVDSLNQVCKAHGFDVDTPWNELSDEQKKIIWFGSEKVKILFGKHSLESRLKWSGITAKPREEGYYKGMLPIMEEILHRDRNENILRFASEEVCPACNGSRLNEYSLQVKIDGKSIWELSTLTISKLFDFFKSISLTENEKEIAEDILNQISLRLKNLMLLGLSYLTLSRNSNTLSGGEAQRIRISAFAGGGMQNVLYVFDEPSIGLHSRDTFRLITVLKELTRQGNTVIVVEHDEEIIRTADYVVDLGPGAGVNGGNLLFQGLNKDFRNNELSITNSWLRKKREFKNYKLKEDFISIKGIKKFNLKNINVKILKYGINVVTGVSGAGKSTLVNEVIGKYLIKSDSESKFFESIENGDSIKNAIYVTQSTIGKTSRSNPATYTKVFDLIRNLFANTDEAKKRSYKKSRFSFNNTEGVCSACEGSGSIKIGMHFLGDVEKECEKCGGKRFNNETLEIKYNGKNIAEVLDLSISEAEKFFENENKIRTILSVMNKIGIGYLKLGQPSSTLSGGEAQRIKLASELHKSKKGETLYVLDEPTTGLHSKDVDLLLIALNELVEKGNTVIVVEHNLDFIYNADWLIDLGPDSGSKGGEVVFIGYPKNLLKSKTYTAKALMQNEACKVNEVLSPQTKNKSMLFKNISTNNLKNINTEIFLNKITMVTGVSGSGKSSLVFDTIYSQCRNKFTESMSSYARRMMTKIKRPDIEESRGLTPVIAISQKKYSVRNPRSILASVTEIFDLYRLLFSRFGLINGNNISPNEFSMSAFTFNSPEGSCSKCNGLGRILKVDPEKFITDKNKSILSGGLDGSKIGKFYGDKYGQYVNILKAVGNIEGIDFYKPWNELTLAEKEIVMEGIPDKKYNVEWVFKRGNREGIHSLLTEWKGFSNLILEEYKLKQGKKSAKEIEKLLSEFECDLCEGKRYNSDVLKIKYKKLNISDLLQMTIEESFAFFKLLNRDNEKQIIEEISEKLKNLLDIGLGYLQLNRLTETLSGGELQRVRLASQLSSKLCGVTYILDEPTLGLGKEEIEALVKIIKKIQAMGNTFIIVDHNKELIKIADNIIELGPKAGTDGGKITFTGTTNEFKKSDCLTSKYFYRNKNLLREKNNSESFFQINNANLFNLKNINIKVPKNNLVVITGKSGAGKSTLFFDVLYQSIAQNKSIGCSGIVGADSFEDVISVDQNFIHTSKKSLLVTFTEILSPIKKIFASTELAKKKEVKEKEFSIGQGKGVCENCKGEGIVTTALDFLSDVSTVCEVCNGKRFKDYILEIKYNNLNLNDVLNLTVTNGIDYFHFQKSIVEKLQLLNDVGLGYLKLGQPTSQMSGGELQRLKLANNILKKERAKVLYLFDEPTSGLHYADVENLILLFDKLITKGASIICITHNELLIENSDYIIELGPKGGPEGGRIIRACKALN